MIFLVFFWNEKSEYKILSAKMFVVKLVIELMKYFVAGFFPFEEYCYPKTLIFFPVSLFYNVTKEFSEWHYNPKNQMKYFCFLLYSRLMLSSQ